MSLQTISPEEVFQLQSDGKPIRIIDVRTPGEYAAVHARGAQLVPLNQLDPQAVMADAAADQPLYVICQSGTRTAQAIAKFQAAGFNSRTSRCGKGIEMRRVRNASTMALFTSPPAAM